MPKILVLESYLQKTFFFFEFSWNAQLCLIVMNMSSYWWIGPISSITFWNVYTKRTNTTQKRNSTGLWWLFWDQVTLYNSNIFGILINVSEQCFPNKGFENFWLYLSSEVCADSKLLKSPHKVHELNRHQI